MASHNTFVRPAVLLTVALTFQVPAVASDVAMVDEAQVEAVARRAPPINREAHSVADRAPVTASLTPTVTVRGGSSEERERLALALSRFADLEMALPNLEVVFDPTGESCKGHSGLFQQGFSPWRISICEDVNFVYEHELTHAWEAATLTDDVRDEFMALLGYSSWNDAENWNDRGCEGVAFVIQQALSGPLLPPWLSDAQRERMAAFELLTGSEDPRLAVWEATYAATEPAMKA